MQSAYFSYPRDFVGTTRQARRRLAVRGHADFRATPMEKPTELHLNLRNPVAPGGLGSSLAPATRKSRRDPISPGDESFLSFLRGGLPRFSLPSLSYPSAFYRSPAHFCALRCFLDCPLPLWPRCPRPAAVDSAKFFSDPSRLLALRFVPRFGALRKEIKWNGSMKIYRAKIRRFLSEYEVSRRPGKTGR